MACYSPYKSMDASRATCDLTSEVLTWDPNLSNNFRNANYAEKIYRFHMFEKVRKFLKDSGKLEDVVWAHDYVKEDFEKMLKKHGKGRVPTRKELEWERDHPFKRTVMEVPSNKKVMLLVTFLIMLFAVTCEGIPLEARTRTRMCGDVTFLIPVGMTETPDMRECCNILVDVSSLTTCIVEPSETGITGNGRWHRYYNIRQDGKEQQRGHCGMAKDTCNLWAGSSQEEEEAETEATSDVPPQNSTTSGTPLSQSPSLSTQRDLVYINHNGCQRLPSLETEVKILNGQELCIVKCKSGDRFELGFENRNLGMKEKYEWPECWEESFESYMSLEDRDIVREIMISNYRGTARVQVCTLDLPIEGQQPVGHFKIWLNEKPVEVQVWESCDSYRLPKECKVTIKGAFTDVSVKMSAKHGSYELHIGKESYKGIFKDTKLIQSEFDHSGEVLVTGICNDIPFKRRIVVTMSEYCDEKYSGPMEIHMNIHCKHYRVIWVLFEVIGISIVLYMTARIVASVLSALCSLLFTLVSYCCLRRILCHRCSCFKLPGRGHICNPRRCIHCGENIVTESDMATLKKEEVDKVMEYHRKKNCRSYTTDRPWALCVINYYRMFYKATYYLLRQAPAITLAVSVIWILGLYRGANALSMKEIHQEIAEQASTCVMNIAIGIMKEQEVEIEARERNCMVWVMFPFVFFYVFSFFFVIFSIPIGFAIRKYYSNKNHRLCKLCGLYGNNWIHSVMCKPVKCPRCNIQLGINLDENLPEHITEFIWTHIDMCESVARASGCSPIAVSAYRRTSRNLGKKILVTGTPIMLSFVFAMLLSCLPGANGSHMAEMSKQELDLNSFIIDLKREGFHPYHARFSGTVREDISAAEETIDCSNDECKLKMHVTSKLVIKEGREYGYTVCPKKKLTAVEKSGCMSFNVKIGQVSTHCSYTDQYETGEVLHKQFSSDTCTGSCGECQKQLEKFKESTKDMYEVNHENTASWSCDGPGCLAINNGCTCGLCFCELRNNDFKVKRSVTESPNFDLCIQVGGEGFCKEVNREFKKGSIEVIKFGEKGNSCPNHVACKGKICYKGEINPKGEFDNKFGSVQKVDNFTASKREERYQENCLFAKHRWVSYDQCCKDTYHMVRGLEPAHLQEEKPNLYRLPADDLGSWEIKIELPTMVFHKNVDKMKLKDLEIKDCKGCAGCDEGGACVLQYTSVLAGVVEFSCEECRTDVSHLSLQRGVKQAKFNVFCPNKKGKITCKVGDTKVMTDYTLIDKPRTPHGDGLIVMDKERFLDEKCSTILCGLNFSFSGMWIYFIYALIALLSFIILYVVFKVIGSALTFFSKIK